MLIEDLRRMFHYIVYTNSIGNIDRSAIYAPTKTHKRKNNDHSEVKCGHLIILMFFYGFCSLNCVR